MPTSDIPIKDLREHIKKIFDAQKETIDGFGAHIDTINVSVGDATTKLGELSNTYDLNKQRYGELKLRLNSDTQKAEAEVVRLTAELVDDTKNADDAVAQLTLEIKALQAKEAATKAAKSPQEIAQERDVIEKKILENITGEGVPICTGFRIRDDIIITALHCCSSQINLHQNTLISPNCKVGDTPGSTWTKDEELMKYLNITKNDEDDNKSTSMYYRDIMILNKSGDTKSNEMIVPILADIEDITNYEFKVAVHDKKKTPDKWFIKIVPQTFAKNGDIYRQFTADETIRSGMSGSGVFAYKQGTSDIYYYGALSASPPDGPSTIVMVFSLHDLETVARGYSTEGYWLVKNLKNYLKYILHTKGLKLYPDLYKDGTVHGQPKYEYHTNYY